MFDFIRGIIDKYFQSFESSEHGFSRKKVISTTIVFVVAVGQLRYFLTTTDNDLLLEISIINFSFVTSMFGISAAQGFSSRKITSTASLKSNAEETVAETTVVKEQKPNE